MKSIITLVAVISMSFVSCKTKNAASANSNAILTTTTANSTNVSTETSSATGDNQGVYVGKLSHQYKSTGCETVIIIAAQDDAAEMTLIPKDKLSKDVDVDGQLIRFDYRPLKMPQPAGCNVGIPAEITNITKLK
jgi:hypothetical protein